MLNKELINLINTNVVKLIFDFSAEGTPRHSWFITIHRLIKKYKIKSSNVYFISLDMKLGENYDIWSEKFNLPKINIIGLNYLVEFATPWVLKKKKFPIEDFKVDKIREKKFTCLNGAYRASRIKIVSELFRNGLDKDGYISCIGNYGEPPRDSGDYGEVDKDLIKYYMDSVYPRLPIVIDMEKDMELIEPYITRSYVHEMYTNSYFNIVTSTAYNWDRESIMDNSVFLTEHIYKPIFGMQPFIVVTNSGYLDFLRELEFETFPEFFDESYDEIENPIERMNTIVKEIKKICSLSLEELHDRYYNIFAKLEHNRNRLIEMVNDRKMNYGNYLDVFE